MGSLGHLTYLVLELIWAFPVLALQWAVGWRALLARWLVLLLSLAITTVYLSLADGVAIAHGIWSIHGDRTLDLRAGDLPVEEILFFLLTNAMVAQSVVLVLEWRRRSV
jgi:lycopene cyclase domain-containing protein